MNLVVDANVLFAVLIKKGDTHKLILQDKLHLFTPEYVLVELQNHKEEILRKTKANN